VTHEPATGSWRDQAVARSLDSARLRAEKRLQRFLDAALALMESGSGDDFTVQEVVRQSGQSLRTFYSYFAGKHELLLALFEESIQTTAERLRAAVAEEDDPLGRLRRFVVDYFELCRGPAENGPTRALAAFARQLLLEHPKEASQAYVPLVSLLEQLLAEAAEAGAVRPGLRHRHTAGVLLQAISFDSFASTMSGTSVHPDGGETANELWQVLLLGLGTWHG
jgi:AcrR family transcriptional regulator